MIDEYSNLFEKLMGDLLDVYQMKDWGLSWQSFLEQAKSEIDSKFEEWEIENFS